MLALLRLLVQKKTLKQLMKILAGIQTKITPLMHILNMVPNLRYGEVHRKD